MLLLKTIPLLVLGFLSLLTALLVLQRSSKKGSNLAFSFLAVGVAGWVLGVAAFMFAQDETLALLFARIYYLSPLLIGASMLALAFLFPDKARLRKRFLVAIIASFTVFAAPLILYPAILAESIIYHDWGKEVILNPLPYALYSGYLIVTFMISLIVFFVKSRHLSGLFRSQAKLLFLGILISAIFGVLFNLILPALGNYRLIHLGPLASSFFLVTIAYSIVRHKMFNVQLIIVRSTAYALSLAVIVVMYGISSYALSALTESSVESAFIESTLNIALLVLVAVTFNPLKRIFDRQTSRLFYRDAYNPEEFLAEVNRMVVSSVDVDMLLKKVSGIIAKNLKTEFAVFELYKTAYLDRRVIAESEDGYPRSDIETMDVIVADSKDSLITPQSLEVANPEGSKRLQKQNIAAIAKLNPFSEVSSSGYGLLVIGPKKSGNQFSKQDLNLIRIIAGELSIAVQNALRFEEIEQFNVTLQVKVNDATKKLRRTNEKLEAMDETKDEFISMASHQLRTPLTSVKGYVSMVLEGDASEINDMQRKLLEQAFVSSQRMVYLIADLLNLSRLRTGKFVIEAKPTNLSEVVESEVEQLKESASSRSLKLDFDKPKDFPTLMLDETKIRQVLMNFIDNAIYYTPSGGKIAIKLTETEKAVEFKVHDNGIGVPKSEQHHLFNKFYRARNAQKARPDGTGLGLFMAKKVVVAQGGAIIFDSAEGKGSTFGFTFRKDKLRVPEEKVEETKQ